MYSLIIIDDEDKIVNGISMLFPWNNIGYQIVNTFTSAGDALNFIRENPVDCILTDIEMPDMSGIELAGRVHELNPDTQIVFFSSYDKYEYFRAAIQLGAVDYLMKPIHYGQLLDCFSKVSEKLQKRKKAEAVPEWTADGDVIRQVQRYLEEQYMDASLEEAAELVGLSPSYLSRFFREKVGISFRDYLLKVKMEKACGLIADERNRMYDIAYFVGYDNPKNFSRAFKAYFGITPQEYRQKGREGKDTEANAETAPGPEEEA